MSGIDRRPAANTVEALDDHGLEAIQQNFDILFSENLRGFRLPELELALASLATGRSYVTTADDGTLSVQLIPIPATDGGTGLTSYTIGDILYALTTSSLATLADVSAGSYLRSGGVATAPVWSTLKLPNAATTGDLLAATASNSVGVIAAVTAGKVLRAAGTSTLPAYSTFTISDTFAAGDIPHASSTNTVTALTVGAAGKVIRSTGTLPAYSTFTIPDTFAQGDLIYGSASNVLTALAKDANATRYLSNTGSSNNPAWAQVALATGVSGDLPYANITPATLASKLLGRGAALGGGDWEEVTIGAGLTMTGTTISATGGAGGNTLLDGANHTDTVSQAATRGSLIYANATPLWDELVIGAANRVLRSDGTDVSWAQVALASDVSGDLPFANLTAASAASKLLGRGDSGAGDFQEISLGSGLSMSGTTLSASGSGTNALLDGSAHTDTVAQTVSRGSIIYGNSTPKWDELVIGSSGKVLTSDGTDVSWQTPSAGGNWTLVSKAATTARTNNTLAADPDLVFAMSANTTYQFKLYAFWNSNTTPDFKYSHSGPASPTSVNIHRHVLAPSTVNPVWAGDIAYLGASAVTVSVGLAAELGIVFMDGVIENGANAGNFEFQWAQNTTNASAANVLKGSYLEYRAL